MLYGIEMQNEQIIEQLSRLSPTSSSEQEQDAMRCVADGKGNILYVSPALGWALGKQSDSLTTDPVSSILKIVTDEKGLVVDKALPEVSGFYEIALYRATRDPLLVRGRVDLTSVLNGKKYIVFWLNPEGEDLSVQDVSDYVGVANKVADIIDKERPSIVKSNTDLSKKDGELRHFINLSNDLFGIYDANEQFVRVNYAFNRISGFSDEELREFPFINLIHPDDKDSVLRHMEELSATPRGVEARIDFSARLIRPDGSVRYVEWIQKLSNGHLYIVGEDTTERRLHEQDLKRAKDAAESAYASKTRFLANMSHELRTPLNAIIGFSEMMQRQLLGPVGNERYLDYIGGIRESGEHLLDLINDILDMSKIEVGKYELEREEFNIGKSMRLAVHMMEGRALDAGVRLISENISDDIRINADRRAVMQVLLNLMSNAIKFTEDGGQVDLSCVQEGVDDDKSIKIIVKDTGIGIPEDRIEHITQPFEQVDCELTRQHEGSGLGLAITQDLIDLHGGVLSIESTLGVGTCVTVTLPVIQNDCPDGDCEDQGDTPAEPVRATISKEGAFMPPEPQISK